MHIHWLHILHRLGQDRRILSPGCYKFQILDTGGNQYTNEDGLSWWANNDGSGYARLKSVPGGFFKYYQADFGTEITDYFRVPEWSVGLLERNLDLSIEIYPNPSNKYINLDIDLRSESSIMVIIRDMNGKITHKFKQSSITSDILIFDISALNNGIYKGLYKFGWFLKQSNIYNNN